MPIITMRVLLLLFMVTLFQKSDAIATMAIDLGSEFMKVAIVKPGVPMETALNRDSQRKTPVVISMRNNERSIGDPALSTAVKFPPNAFIYVPTIVGKSIDSPAVQEFKKRFPYYKLSTNEHGALTFETPEKQKYTVEEILAMLLENAQETAQNFADQPIKDAVITVPPYFSQADRKAVLRAAEYAGISVLQLMNSNAAVALNFGIFRSKSFNKTAQYYMFFDMGSSSTIVSVVAYQVGRVREHGMVEEHPQLQIMGVGYDESLGGTSFILRLRDHLAKEFNNKKLSKKDITKNDRAMAKIFKEAARIYRILSANKEVYAQIENVFDDKDFKLKVTREELEQMCDDLFNRVQQPIEKALNMAQVPLDIIKEVILMGGGTRNPKVQEMVLKATGKSELGKSINTDEAAALGAVYQAAHLSPGFRVKRFVVKDATLFPLAVDFQTAEDKRSVKRVLFNIGNPYPQRKVMTFNKHSGDFAFSLGYTGLTHLSELQQRSLGSTQLYKYNLKGVGSSVKKYESRPDATSKGVKAHFRMDDSGMIDLDRVEALFELAPAAAAAADADASEKPSSTLGKLGESIGNLFGSGKKDEAAGADKTKSDDGSVDKEQKKDETDKAAASNATATNATNAVNTTAKAEIVRETIEFVAESLSSPEPSETIRQKSRAVIMELKQRDDEKQLLEKARNELESYIFDTKDKLSQEDFVKCSADAERQDYMEKLSAAQDWYDEQGMDTKKEEFTAKTAELKKLLNDLTIRVREMRERPKAFKMLKDMLNHTKTFWDTMKNMTGEGNVFTQAEYTALGNLINDTQQWINNTERQLAKQPKYEMPLVRTVEIVSRASALQAKNAQLLRDKLKRLAELQVKFEAEAKERKQRLRERIRQQRIEKRRQRMEQIIKRREEHRAYSSFLSLGSDGHYRLSLRQRRKIREAMLRTAIKRELAANDQSKPSSKDQQEPKKTDDKKPSEETVKQEAESASKDKKEKSGADGSDGRKPDDEL